MASTGLHRQGVSTRNKHLDCDYLLPSEVGFEVIVGVIYSSGTQTIEC